MKNLIIIIAGCMLLFGSATVLAAPNLNAITNQVAQQSGYDVKGTSDTTISELVGRVIRYSLGFLGTIFLVLTIYAGVLRATAGGNEEQVGKSNNIFKMSVVGAIIIVSSYSLTTLVFRYIVTPQAELDKIQDTANSTVMFGAQDNPGCCYFRPSYDQSREVCNRSTRTMCNNGDQITDGSSGGEMTNTRFVDCSASEYNACSYSAVQADAHVDDNNIWGGEIPDLPEN